MRRRRAEGEGRVSTATKGPFSSIGALRDRGCLTDELAFLLRSALSRVGVRARFLATLCRTDLLASKVSVICFLMRILSFFEKDRIFFLKTVQIRLERYNPVNRAFALYAVDLCSISSIPYVSPKHHHE